jgi:hypothetical protein
VDIDVTVAIYGSSNDAFHAWLPQMTKDGCIKIWGTWLFERGSWDGGKTYEESC